jgi:hypothetical protein
MVILSTYEQSWAKFMFCVVNTAIFSALNFQFHLVPFKFMVRGSWPISGHPRPRSLCHGPRTRMPTDESRASNQRSSTRPRRWVSWKAGPRHRHRRAFSWRVETRPRNCRWFSRRAKTRPRNRPSSFVSSIHSLV